MATRTTILKIVTNANNTFTGIQVLLEEGGITSGPPTYNISVLGASYVDLYLIVNPISNMVQPAYSIEGGTLTFLGSEMAIPASWLSDVLAVGFISTSAGPGSPFAATWDFIEVKEALSLGNWQTVNSTNTCQSRHENAYVQAGDKFYLLGGRGIKPVEAFNPADSTWTTGANTPIELHHFQAVEYQGLIYVMGAFTGNYPNEVPVPNIYIYDPVANSWTLGPEIPVDRRRGSGGTVVYNDKIYLIGGLTNGHIDGWVNWVDEFDPKTNEWTILADAPAARDHFHAAVHDDKIYAISGRLSAYDPGDFFSVWDSTIAQVDVYDINTNTWITLPSPQADIPTERAGAAVAVINNEIIVLGGETAQQVAAHVETEALDVNTGSWRTLSDMVTGRHATQAIVNNSGIYICAGAGNRGGSPELNSQEAFYFNERTTPTGDALTKGMITGPASKYMGQQYLGNSITGKLTINNTGGDQGILITSIGITGSSDFSLGTLPSLPILVCPDQPLDLLVTFAPLTAGNKVATLNIGHSGTNGPLAIGLSGDALESIPCGGGGDSTNYEEQNGLLIMEVESAPTSGDWHALNTIPGYTGSSYYKWDGNGQFSNPPTQGILDYTFNISTPGRYRFHIRSYQPGPGGADENDVWAHFPDAQAKKYRSPDTTDLNGWFKVYQNSIEVWTFNSFNVDFTPNDIYVDFNTAGEYNLQLAGRSSEFSIDRIVLYHINSGISNWQATAALPAESPNGSGTGGDCSPELLTWYTDADNDNYGVADDSILAETQPVGFAATNDDCNDNDNTIHPGAAEVEDSIDNNCNGLVDEGLGGSYEALFVVGNTSLNSGDQAVKDRLEFLGFNVTVVDDQASTTADADDKGLVVISSTVISGSVNTKFKDVTVPLVNWESALFDDLDMVGGFGEYGSIGGLTEIEIINSIHPLGGGLSAGSTTVYTSGANMSWGTPNANAIKIATVTGDPDQLAIFGFETGTLMDGINAPARRVGFLLHDIGASLLNADGFALLDAAILWASNVNANQSPSVSILSPLQNESFSAPAVVGIAADASDPDGNINKVEFYNGATLLATDQTFPYGYSWTNVPVGNYTIVVVATDNEGGLATDTVNISVTVPSITLTNPSNGEIVVGDELMVFMDFCEYKSRGPRARYSRWSSPAYFCV